MPSIYYYPILLWLLIHGSSALAQEEFIATVDRTTGAHQIVDSLPEVQSITVSPRMSTFDEVSKHFLFVGKDQQEVKRLYSVDAVSGNIEHSPPFPVLSDPEDHVALLEFDNTSGNLYAVYRDESKPMEYLVTVDRATGTHTVIDSLPGVLFVNASCFNETTGEYILHMLDNNWQPRLCVINTATGDVLADPEFPESIHPNEEMLDMQFDHTTNQLYGLLWNSLTQVGHIVIIDPIDGSRTILFSVPNMGESSFPPNAHFFDEANGWYTFKIHHTTSAARLYTMDIATGALLHNPIFPGQTNPAENLIEFNFDQSSGTLYALNGNPEIGVGISAPPRAPGLSVFPNPFNDRTTIQLDHTAQDAHLRLIDALGRVVVEWENLPSTTIEFQKEQLKTGVYFLEVRSEGERTVQKVVVQ